jgi:queuine tRNA-ribosyltransferase
MEEARALYVEQSFLRERLSLSEAQGGSAPDGDAAHSPLVIWDVGLGAAANAMAAIECYEALARQHPVRPLKIVSFENDLDSLDLAFRNSERFPYLRHSGPAWILRQGEWTSREFPGLSWCLLKGDFLQTLGEAKDRPDVIFYDMFSSKTCGDVWTHTAFQRLFEACADGPTDLFTYTCSTAARVALLAAGFFVARGRNAGEKVETTIALTPASALSDFALRYDWLGSEWLAKWERSAARFPKDLPEVDQGRLERRIREHPQFRRARVAEAPIA